jgi:hypothetical protein
MMHRASETKPYIDKMTLHPPPQKKKKKQEKRE